MCIALVTVSIAPGWLAKKIELPLERFVRGFVASIAIFCSSKKLANRGAGRVIVNSHMVRIKSSIITATQDRHRPQRLIQQFRFDTELREKARDELKKKPDQMRCCPPAQAGNAKACVRNRDALCRNRKMHLLVAGLGNQRVLQIKAREVPGRATIWCAFAAADIFILPIYDPFSNACLEALACGLPVITTRDNGFNEIIEHGCTARLRIHE